MYVRSVKVTQPFYFLVGTMRYTVVQRRQIAKTYYENNRFVQMVHQKLRYTFDRHGRPALNTIANIVELDYCVIL